MPPATAHTPDAAVDPAETDLSTAFAEPTLEDLGAILSGEASLSPAPDAVDDDDPDGDDADLQAADPADAIQDEDSDDESADDAAAAGDEDDAVDATSDDDDDLDAEGKKARATFTPAQQRIFDREIAKVKRKAREAATTIETEVKTKAEQLATLTAEVERLRTAQPAPTVAATTETPLAGVDDETELEKRLDQARLERRWALRHPQGGTVPDGNGGEIDITEEQAAAMLANSEDLIEKHAPKRREFLKARAQGEQTAKAIYPWLADAKNEHTLAVDSVLRRYPVLREIFPDARLNLAHMLVGLQFTQHQLAKAKQSTTAKSGTGKPVAAHNSAPKAPASPAGGTRAPVVKAGQRTRQTAIKRFAETGEDSDGAALGALLSATG